MESNEALTEELYKLGGTEGLVMESEEIKNMFFPIIRKDFSIIKNYRYQEGSRINVDISVLFGDEDNNEGIDEWRNLTDKKAEFYCFSGGHFFINDSYREVVQLVNKLIQE